MSQKPYRPSTKDRRNVLRGLATGLAGAVAAPGLSAPGEAGAATAPLKSPVTPAPSSPAHLLDPHEHAILAHLSELLVPGSAGAGVPDLVDRVAAVESPEDQRALRDGLRAFEGEARRRHAKPWTELEDEARLAIVERAASSRESALYRHFVSLRDRVARAYLSTEAGMRELGWRGRSAWRELPVCRHDGDDHR